MSKVQPKNLESGGSKPMGLIGVALLLALLLPLARPYLGRAYGEAALLGGRILLWPWPQGSSEAGLREWLTAKEGLSPGEADIVWAYLGRKYRWICLSLTALLTFLAAKRDPGHKYKFCHDMWSLLKVSSSHFPCLRPILKSGPVTEKENFQGEWALARTPLQFVLEHKLLLDAKGVPYEAGRIMDFESGLEREENPALGQKNSLSLKLLRGILVSQLGSIFDGEIEKLPGYQRALAAAFLAQAMEHKEAALAILDQLASGWSPKKGCPDPELADGLLKTLREELAAGGQSQVGRLKEALGRHRSFVCVWFMGLLELARTKGALPSSLWIWLKPTDRLLFYALNQVGSRVAWVEAAGAASHYAAEKDERRALSQPRLEAAVSALRTGLAEGGYLAQEEEDDDIDEFEDLDQVDDQVDEVEERLQEEHLRAERSAAERMAAELSEPEGPPEEVGPSEDLKNRDRGRSGLNLENFCPDLPGEF